MFFKNRIQEYFRKKKIYQPESFIIAFFLLWIIPFWFVATLYYQTATVFRHVFLGQDMSERFVNWSNELVTFDEWFGNDALQALLFFILVIFIVLLGEIFFIRIAYRKPSFYLKYKEALLIKDLYSTIENFAPFTEEEREMTPEKIKLKIEIEEYLEKNKELTNKTDMEKFLEE